MVDFRSADERDADRTQTQRQQTDYKLMYQDVLAENTAIRQRMSELDAKYGEAMNAVNVLHIKFEELRKEMNGKADEMRQVGDQMHQTVSTGYQQQSDLMERFRADISQRLAKAQEITTQHPSQLNGPSENA